MVAAISGAAAAFGGVTCVACAPAGLGRCTRMHKELKPRSMSETGHLPTDVESSGRDPGAATLQPGPTLSPPSFYLALLTLSLSLSSCSWRVGTFRFSAPGTFVRHSALCESQPVLSTCLWTSSGSSCFLRIQEAIARSKKASDTDIF